MDNYHTLSNYKGAEGLYCPTAWELKSKRIKFFIFSKLEEISSHFNKKQNETTFLALR